MSKSNWTDKDLEAKGLTKRVDGSYFRADNKIAYLPKNRKSKYNVADKSERMYNGKVYDSKLERDYRVHLELLKSAANPNEKVIEIKEQHRLAVTIKGIHICNYVLDFAVAYADGRFEYIDVKGVRTAIYKLKKKMVEAHYEIKIKEVIKGQF